MLLNAWDPNNRQLFNDCQQYFEKYESCSLDLCLCAFLIGS